MNKKYRLKPKYFILAQSQINNQKKACNAGFFFNNLIVLESLIWLSKHLIFLYKH